MKHTVDGRNPAPPRIFKTLKIMGLTTNLNWLAGFLPSTAFLNIGSIYQPHHPTSPNLPQQLAMSQQAIPQLPRLARTWGRPRTADIGGWFHTHNNPLRYLYPVLVVLVLAVLNALIWLFSKILRCNTWPSSHSLTLVSRSTFQRQPKELPRIRYRSRFPQLLIRTWSWIPFQVCTAEHFNTQFGTLGRKCLNFVWCFR